MGFSTLIDILGSVIVGGMLFMILLRMNDTSVKNTYKYGGDLLVQQNLVEIVTLLEHDFRKIGYCRDWQKIPDPSKAIIYAASEEIKFLTDEDNDGEVDTMRYYLGPASELVSTPNPRDRMLYRVTNSETPLSANLGVTQFEMVFYNALGDSLSFPIAVPSEIYTMQINITVENYAAYEEDYSNAFWRQIRMAARNLRNR